MHICLGAQDAPSSESDSFVSSSISESSLSPSTSVPCTYVIVGDNLDKTISSRYMRSDHQRQSIHYCHMYAALDHVSALDLSADHPVGDISTTPLTEFLPSPADCKVLCENYAVLLRRVVVKKLTFFRVFEDCIVSHITHEHSDVMKQKSVIVRHDRTIVESAIFLLKCILADEGSLAEMAIFMNLFKLLKQQSHNKHFG